MLFSLFKKHNVKKYDHIISLGYNCETSFHFFKNYGFVESSLFAWVNTINIENLIYALNNFDKLCTGVVDNTKPMWKCYNTNIYFHGKYPMGIWHSDVPVSQDVYDSDKKELLERVNYLKTKFFDIAKDDSKKLYIFKYLIKENDVLEKIEKNIENLYESLSSCSCNFDLLIIFERKNPLSISNLEFDTKSDNKIYVRFVNFFSNENNVVDKRNNDFKNWKIIFKEFRPKFKLKKTKTFKFEDV